MLCYDVIIPSGRPEFRTGLNKIFAGLEHSQNPVLTEFKLDYNKIMSLMVKTFSSGLRVWTQ
jgi:hypothetical protein